MVLGMTVVNKILKKQSASCPPSLREVLKMATRKSMDDFFQQCEDVIRFAQNEYNEANKQEHYNSDNYTEALNKIEETYNDLTGLAHSANGQQREQLHRMRLQLQQIQNSMILLDH